MKVNRTLSENPEGGGLKLPKRFPHWAFLEGLLGGGQRFRIGGVRGSVICNQRANFVGVKHLTQLLRW